MDKVPPWLVALKTKLVWFRGRIAAFRGWQSYDVRSSEAQVTARSNHACQPQRLMLPANRAASWIIHDIRIGHTSQFAAANGVPGEVFSANNMDAGIATSPIAAGVDITIAVEYVGDNPDGEIFLATMLCRTAQGTQAALGFTSAVLIRPGNHFARDSLRRTLIVLDDTTWQFEKKDGALFSVTSVDVPCRQPDDRMWPVSEDYDGDLFRIGETRPITKNELHKREQIAYRSPVCEPDEHAVTELRDPIVVSLHVAHLPRLALFGVRESTGDVVFEVGNTAPQGNQHFASRFKVDGYVPWWFANAQLLEADLRDPAWPEQTGLT